jgi:putative acetyltransferase
MLRAMSGKGDAGITIRHAEPEDARALYAIFSKPQAIAGTLQLPFPAEESWRKRLSEPSGA